VNKPIQASIEKIPPPIPAKSQKEVNQISKYFKNIKPANGPHQSKKLYAQAFKQTSNMNEVIKIKDTFLALSVQKINQIHKIVSSNTNSKPHIQMTSKELLRKQVIIPMSSDNISKFMKNSSLHVANINQSLRTVKSEVLVNFICLDLTSVMVVTNKITVQSDLHVI